MKHHRNWRLPERRVAKFVKRQQLSVMPWEQTDDEVSRSSSVSSMKRAKSAMSSAMKGTSKGLRKVLTFGRSGGQKEADDLSTSETLSTTPPSEITADLSIQPAVSYDELDGKKRLQFFTPTNAGTGGETFKVTGIAKRTASGDPYVDDNDGKRDSSLCQPCEGCVIL